ncbi:MAG: DUF4349 domain-containing protein [Firmicutes bacterium]|nr:DUF4349 domain-containing protein [Bacillota bacterium]
MKRSLTVLLTVLVLFLFVGCSSGSSDTQSAIDSGGLEVSDEVSNKSADSSIVPKVDASFSLDKIIRTGRVELYTEDYLKTVDKINSYVNGIGGFVQSSNDIFGDSNNTSVGSSGYMTIRVPSAKFSSSMDEIKSYGRVVSSSTNSENITENYQDISSELNSLKVEESRLLNYLTKADKIADMLTIESELTRVRTEINAKTSILNNYDKQVGYSTININLTESKSATGNIESPFSDFGLKISSGFASSINFLMYMLAGLIVLFFRLLPFLVIIGVVSVIVWIVHKKTKK